MSDALADLSAQDVSIWLDDISRERLRTGNLQDLVDDQARRRRHQQPDDLPEGAGEGRRLRRAGPRPRRRAGVALDEAIRLLTAYDIRWACDVLRAGLRRAPTARTAGCRSRSTRGSPTTPAKTTAEAKALWWLVDRPNVHDQDPGDARRACRSITDGDRRGHQRQRHADLLPRPLRRGHGRLPDRARAGQGGRHRPVDDPLGRVVLRLPRRHRDRQAARQDRHATRRKALRGKAGIANARLAYERYEKVFGSDRWKALAGGRARHEQRPLWASTGVKDPTYDDTMYVVDLVAPNTVNTMPEATLDAVADHGEIRGNTIARHLRTRRSRCSTTSTRIGIDYDDVVEVLEVEGVQKFEDSWAQLLEGVQGQLDAASG